MGRDPAAPHRALTGANKHYSMTKTSLDKTKIKILLLEGIHPSAVDRLAADGYTNIEYHEKSLSAGKNWSAPRPTPISSASARPRNWNANSSTMLRG